MKHQDNFMNNWLIFIELATYLITADSITLFEGTNHIFHLWKKPPEKNCLLQKWSKLATKKSDSIQRITIFGKGNIFKRKSKKIEDKKIQNFQKVHLSSNSLDMCKRIPNHYKFQVRSSSLPNHLIKNIFNDFFGKKWKV